MELDEINCRELIPKDKKISVDLNTLKKVLDHDFKGEEEAKLLIFFISLGSYRKSHQIIVLTGDILKLRTQLIKTILNLHPEEFTYINSDTGATCKRALVFKDWDKEKLIYITNFEKNKDLIHKFIQDEWSFSIVINDKDSPKKSFTIDMDIPPMSILTTTTQNNLNEDIEKNAFILESNYSRSQSRVRSEYNAYKSGNYAKILTHNQSINVKRKNIKQFLKNLDLSFKVEIPYEIAVRKYFNYNLPRSEIYHYFFLELIKNITFFHQNKRDWYLIKRNRKKVLLSHPLDLQTAFEIGEDVFSRVTQNLEAKHINFLNFIHNSLKVKTSKNQVLSLGDKEFTRNKLISDYRDHLEKKGIIPKSPRTYENYLDYLVKKKCLAHRKISNINYYRLKNVPSLKCIDIDVNEEEAFTFYKNRVKELTKDTTKEFFKVDKTL